jgi:RNA polymerase sigma factor (TIGR02999 family)
MTSCTASRAACLVSVRRSDLQAALVTGVPRLFDVQRVDWQNRAHFLAMAARLITFWSMPEGSGRRGATWSALRSTTLFAVGDRAAELINLDAALDALAALDDRKGRVVELRFFGGLSLEETAEALGVSTKTVARDWEFAKMWLRREILGATGGDA